MAEPPKTVERRDDEAADAPRHDTAEMPVTKAVMRSALRVNEVWTVIVAIATAAGALLAGYALFISKAEAAGEKAAAEVSKRQDKLEAAQSDIRADVRELYKAVVYGRRSERLEAPPDGGK